MNVRNAKLVVAAILSIATAIAETKIEDVSVTEFQELVAQNNGIILDVRTPDEIAQGHISGASMLNIYDEDFERKLNLMQKDKPIYVYCRSGGRSSRAAQIMGENGFSEVYNLEGGMGAWNRANLPTIIPDGGSVKKAPGISLADFKKQLRNNDRVLVDFQTEWCAPCKQMVPIIDALEDELSDRARILRIDIDASPELAEAYAIEGVPVFILFEKGQETWRHSGAIAREALEAKL